jgi:hypothetical protein
VRIAVVTNKRHAGRCRVVGQRSLRYHLESTQHKEVIATSTDRGVRFAPGASVCLTWRRDDVWVIPN